MDPENPVVKLCAEGMQAEMEGRHDDARVLFARAWEASTDDYEACIAAHYVARRQESAGETLRWNRVALERADRAGGERVRDFYPSLYLNLGWSHESLADLPEARRWYERAAAHLGGLPEGPYTNMVRRGVEAALERTS